MVKQAVVEQVRSFYCRGFDESSMLFGEEGYARAVTSLERRKFRASAKWLVQSGAISNEQVEVLERRYVHRKDMAHELVKYLIDVDHGPDADLFIEALKALRDIQRFWTQIEIDIGTFEAHGDVTVDDVQPLSLTVLTRLIDAYGARLPGAQDGGQTWRSAQVTR
jgi:hypothetical protein